MKIKRAVFIEAHPDKEPRIFAVKGKTAQALCELIKNPNGVTKRDCHYFTLRLSQCVSDLRYRHKMEIETEKLDSTDGWYGRYKLLSNVTVFKIEV